MLLYKKSISLAKKFVQVFLLHLMENSEWAFWPTQGKYFLQINKTLLFIF